MNKFFSVLLLAGNLMGVATGAQAEESVFLRSLQGKWAGNGIVKIRTNSVPLAVSCHFDSSATNSSLSLDGSCSGLILISRTIGANLKFNGANYTGSYSGAGTGMAALFGSRRDNSINLGIRWAKNVNGDRRAQLVLQKVGNNGMRLTTEDVDPMSGETVVTSEINLLRQ
jgi:hypothetical protein